MNGRKGVIVGISTVISTAFAVGISFAGGLVPDSPILVAHTAMAAGSTVLVCGLPVAMLFGWLLGTMAIDLPPLARTAIFIVVALLALGLCLPFWPGIAPLAAPIAIVHAMALSRWTAPSEALPRAIVRRSR